MNKRPNEVHALYLISKIEPFYIIDFNVALVLEVLLLFGTQEIKHK